MTTLETRHHQIFEDLYNLDGKLPPNNKVLIKITADTSKTKSGIYLSNKDWDFNGANHAERFGIVEAIPDCLIYAKSGNMDTNNKLLWETPLEVKKGDVVLFDHYSALNAPMVRFNNEIYKFIEYGALTALKNDDGSIYPLNGYCFFSEVFKESHELGIGRKVVDIKYGIVTHKGTPNKSYWKTGRCDDGIDLEIGDKVLFSKAYAQKYRYKIEYEMHAVFSDIPLIMAHRHWVEWVFKD